MVPGEIALTRIPRPLSSLAQVRAKDRIAALEAAYVPKAATPSSARTEEFRITDAPSFSSGSAFCTVNDVPRTLTPKVSS